MKSSVPALSTLVASWASLLLVFAAVALAGAPVARAEAHVAEKCKRMLRGGKIVKSPGVRCVVLRRSGEVITIRPATK